MRDAKRALGGTSAHRPRLKGATARRVRRFLGAAFPQGSCAFQARVLFEDAAPSGVSPHGVIFVPHFMRDETEDTCPACPRKTADGNRSFSTGIAGISRDFLFGGNAPAALSLRRSDQENREKKADFESHRFVVRFFKPRSIFDDDVRDVEKAAVQRLVVREGEETPRRRPFGNGERNPRDAVRVGADARQEERG